MTWEPSLLYRNGKFASVFLQKILTIRNYKLLSVKQYIYIISILVNLIKKFRENPKKEVCVLGQCYPSSNPGEDPHCKEIYDSLAPVARISVQVISRGLFARCGTLRLRVWSFKFPSDLC